MTIRLKDAQLAALLEEIQPGLGRDLELMVGAEDDVVLRALRTILEFSCSGQSISATAIARDTVRLLPREWLMPKLGVVACELARESDEWVYRRLCEVCLKTDKGILSELIDIGLSSSNPDVLEAAEDFRETRDAL